MRSESNPSEVSHLPATVAVARILRPRGLAGDLVAALLSDVPGRLVAGRECLLTLPDEPSRPIRIVASRPHPSGVVLRLAGCTDRSGAESLRGAYLEVARDSVPPAGPGSYYKYELVGCRCIDAAHGELGTVADLVADGGGLLLVIEGPHGLVPVPFAAEFIETIDREQRSIRLRLPPGLVETCASRS